MRSFQHGVKKIITKLCEPAISSILLTLISGGVEQSQQAQ